MAQVNARVAMRMSSAMFVIGALGALGCAQFALSGGVIVDRKDKGSGQRNTPPGIEAVNAIAADDEHAVLLGGNTITPPQCTNCCDARPPLVESLATPFAPGNVVAVTLGREDAPAGNIGVLRLVDIGDQSAAPLVGSGSLWSPQEYAHPQWDLATLGNIFGVTFDGQGNIYVAQSMVYADDVFGSLGVSSAGDGRGAIYRIDGVTGVPTLFRTLPQASGLNAALGLGNLDFDCSRNCLIVTNLEDGRIYSINATTGAVNTFGSASGVIEAESATGNGDAIAAGANPNGTSTEPPGFAGYGKSAYAVAVAGDRVYYSIWQAYGVAQTVHSVQLDAVGAFVAGTSRLEMSIPYAPLHPYQNVNCPITDISFDDQCCMMLGERSMTGPSASNAHNSRAWRACFDADAAAWSPVRYDVGSQGFPTDWQNCSGGIGFVNGSNGPQAWLTGDFFAPPAAVGSYYGISGIPLLEANPGQIDTILGPGVNMTGNKFAQGSLDITCVSATELCEFNTVDIDCRPNDAGTMGYLWTVELVNNSLVPANILILGDPAFSPNNVVLLNPPLLPGSSMFIDIPISSGDPGSVFCFTATLAASFIDQCCTTKVCITLPECSCIDTEVVTADLPGVGSFTFNMNILNLTPATGTPFSGEYITLAVAPGIAATVNPTLVDIPTLPIYASTWIGPITVNTALPSGSTIILIVGIHSQTFHPCCFREVKFTVPARTGSTTPGDVNADGVVDGTDLAMLLSNWGLPGTTDLNSDGTTDAQDLALMLANWG